MAEVTMTPVKGNVNEITKFAFEAATTAKDGLVVKLPRITEEYVVIVVTNTGSGAQTVSLKAPTNGSYAAASADVTVSLGAGEFAQIRIESARYANNDGTVRLVPSDVAVKAALLY